MSTPVEWGRFSLDPRSPSHATLRAGDADRNVALDAVSQAYAEGRLTREEYDERSATLTAAATFGELLEPLRDLTADSALPAVRQETSTAIRRKAEDHYADQFRGNLLRLVVPNVVCWTIYLWVLFAGHGTAFPWPIFVTVGTGMGLLNVVGNKKQIIAKRVEKLEKAERDRREIEG